MGQLCCPLTAANWQLWKAESAFPFLGWLIAVPKWGEVYTSPIGRTLTAFSFSATPPYLSQFQKTWLSGVCGEPPIAATFLGTSGSSMWWRMTRKSHSVLERENRRPPLLLHPMSWLSWWISMWRCLATLWGQGDLRTGRKYIKSLGFVFCGLFFLSFLWLFKFVSFPFKLCKTFFRVSLCNNLNECSKKVLSLHSIK